MIDGPSGAGKSTLLYTLGGLVKPDSGHVLFENRVIYAQKNSFLNDYRKYKVGFMFQQFPLMPYLTVKENIKLGCQDKAHVLSVPKYLEECSLTGFQDKYPSELSVGEKQRTAFIRAIISDPVMLLADEPTGNLDPVNSNALMVLVEEYHKKGGTVIIVSHDPSLAGSANIRISMDKGKIIKYEAYNKE